MEEFTPHLFLKVEHEHPRPLFVLAMTNVSTLLRIDMPRVVSAEQLQKTIRDNYAKWEGGLPCYGRILGYYHHYELGRCVEYDVQGFLVGTVDKVPMHYGMRATLSIQT